MADQLGTLPKDRPLSRVKVIAKHTSTASANYPNHHTAPKSRSTKNHWTTGKHRASEQQEQTWQQ